MGEWPLVPIGELCELYDGPHQTAPLSPGGPVVYLNVGDIRGGRIELALSGQVTEETARQWSRRVEPLPGDVVFGYEAKVGEAAMLTKDHRWCLGRRVGLLRPRSGRIDSRYLTYAWYSMHFQDTLRAHRIGGTTIESIRLTDLPSWTIPLPSIDEQRRIAGILGALDDKIELNRRMNETREAIARALFKSWFVDFDPVRAKSEGRDTGLSPHVANLFPDSFEDSELGEVPQGWEVQPFSDTIEIIGGGTPRTSVAEYWHGDIPWFSIVDAPVGSDVWVVDTEKRITQPGVDESSTQVLPVGTTILSARGTVGRVALVGAPMAMNQSCYGLRAASWSLGYFTYFATRELAASLRQHAHGSVFDTITQETLRRVLVTSPPRPMIQAFEARVSPLLDRIRAAVLSSGTLAATRDALLPELISGRLGIERLTRLAEADV